MSSTRVVVADDDSTFRSALVDVLGVDPDLEVVASLSSGTALVETLARTHADVALVDVRMPDGGVHAARAVREATEEGRLHEVAVVAISAQAATHTVVSLLREGVVGYLVKGHLGGDLGSLVKRCARGEVVVAGPSGADALRTLVRDGHVLS